MLKAFLLKVISFLGKGSVLSGIVQMEGSTLIGDLITDTGSLITGVISWATQITTWIAGNAMARLFLAIMLLMLGLHFVKSFIKTA